MKKNQDQQDKLDSLERILRTIIDALGLLVGLCWEKATDAAMEVLIEGSSLSQHVVLSKVGFAAVMMAFMYHAWKKYIVPKAQKSEEEHDVDIKVERLLRQSKNRKALTADLLTFLKARDPVGQSVAESWS